jgi:hypothetical protein
MNPHLDDEALSAALDGYASNTEQAHLAVCPSCRGQLEGLREVSELIAVPVTPPPADVVSQALATAVAAGPGSAGLVRSDRHRPRLGYLVAAAAVVVVVGAGVAAIVRSGSGSSAKTATGSTGRTALAPAPLSTATGGATGDGSPAAGRSPSSSVPIAAGSPTVGLGSYSDAAVLAPVLRRLMAGAPPGAMSAPAGSPCQEVAAAAAQLPRSSVPRLTAGLEWQGQPAVALVYDRGGALGPLAVIVSAPGCAVLNSVPF